METYRIYALIHGDVLYEGNLFGSEIKKISFEEQKKRGFKPISSKFSKDDGYHKTYVTSLPYIDPIKIKSEYVIIHEISERNVEGAIGGAIKAIDKICRFLTLTNMIDVNKKYGRGLGNIEPYIYQVNRIYKINAKGKEISIKFSLKSGHIYLPNRPELNSWRHPETSQILQEIFNFYDEPLERAIKYLYRSSLGYFLLDSQEKIALDHFKSIEILVDSLSGKEKFKDRLSDAGKKIGITPAEEMSILKFWDNRSSYGDVAHPSKFDQAERYPNQFPIPSNVMYPGSFFDSIAGRVCIKYFYYKKSLFYIEIFEPITYKKKDRSTTSNENNLGIVNPGWESNHYYFATNERNKLTLRNKVIESFCKEFGYKKDDIESAVVGIRKKSVSIKIKSSNLIY